MDKMGVAYEVRLGLLAEMVLDEAIRDFEEKRLYREIDNALARGDKVSFRKLTNELKILLSTKTNEQVS